jgi:hypothetical protein
VLTPEQRWRLPRPGIGLRLQESGQLRQQQLPLALDFPKPLELAFDQGALVQLSLQHVSPAPRHRLEHH